MKITDNDFIKWVCEKAGDNIRDICPNFGDYCTGLDCYNCDTLVSIDFNICMKAVESINAEDIYIIEMCEDWWCVMKRGKNLEWKYFRKKEYDNSMLIALQHALLYIMENEK